MKNIFFFDSMLTPKIITFVYWLLLLLVVIAGFGSMFANDGFSFGRLIIGMIVLIAGAVGARIWCELLIVLFKINENMKKVADK